MKQQQNHDLDVLFVLCSRSVLAVAVVVCVFWTHTGCARTLLTSSLRSSWLIHSTRPSAVTPRPTGSANLCTSTVSCVALLQLVVVPAASAKVICSTRLLVVRVAPTGREGIHSAYCANVDFLFLYKIKCLLTLTLCMYVCVDSVKIGCACGTQYGWLRFYLLCPQSEQVQNNWYT